VKYKMEFVRHHVDNGDSRLIVDLGSGTTPISPGDWAIEVLAVTVPEEDALHAWIERRNGPRSEFVSLNVNERMTLSIPGTASSVITVAAIDAMNPIVVGQFSSYGPTRDGRRKPDVCAPGVKVIAARGGTLDDAREDTGTSMAAPHVAGAVALVLSKRARAEGEWPSATQLAAVIRQNTLKRGGRWTPGQGYGVIDVAALLKAF
jgi:subtilisin family serine protease